VGGYKGSKGGDDFCGLKNEDECRLGGKKEVLGGVEEPLQEARDIRTILERGNPTCRIAQGQRTLQKGRRAESGVSPKSDRVPMTETGKKKTGNLHTDTGSEHWRISKGKLTRIRGKRRA